MTFSTVHVLALAAGILASYLFSHLFETSRSFFHLSSLEREMSFRTEQGFYFSFFKEVAKADTISHAISDLAHDKKSEYGTTINAFEKFNIYPEFIAGVGYRSFRQLLTLANSTLRECSEVDRGEDLPPVIACVGLEEPFYFYLSIVWALTGVTAATIVLYGSFLAETPLGGVLAILCYFFNLTEATRVQWAPALRESFGFPFVLLQMYFVTKTLRWRDRSSKFVLKMVFLTTTAATLFWQFSQFIWLTQISLLFGLALLFGAHTVVKRLLLLHLYSLVVSVCLLFGNRLLLTSPYALGVLSCLVALSVPSSEGGFKSDFIRCSVAVVAAVVLKGATSFVFTSEDGGHIWSILLSKFTDYKDFHSMLYTCTPEFDFLSWSTLRSLTETLLLPAAYVAVILLLFSIWKRLDGDFDETYVDSGEEGDDGSGDVQLGSIYTVLQTVVFTIMALLIMRLKLFMTPGLCLVASLLASRKVCYFLPRQLHWSLLFLLVGIMSVKGIANVRNEYYRTGEYSNPSQEELFHWVVSSTSTDNSFAGAMSIMANLKLSTGRPIVNHPHYESDEMRSKTRRIYEVFGRGPKEQLAEDLQHLKVDFLVVDELHCYAKMRPGCGIIDLLDVDGGKKDRPVICKEFFEGDPSPFAVVFQNDGYMVVKSA